MLKQLRKDTVRKIVQYKLNKLFAKHVKGSNGWQYAKQTIYEPWDIFTRLIQACCEHSSIEDVCSDFPGCSADRVQDRINPLDFDQIVHQINSFLQEIAKSFHFHGNHITTLAIDITDKEFYGDPEHEFSKGSKPKNGTCYFNRYFTASIITSTFRLPVYFRPLRQEDSLSPFDLIQEMWNELRSWLPIQRLLGDAYFYSKDVIETCDFYGFEYLFNMTEYKWVKESIAVIWDTLELMARAVGVDTTDIKIFWHWLGKNGLRTWKIPNQAVEKTSPTSEVVLRLRYQKTKKRNGAVREKIVVYSYVTNISASGDYLATLYGSKWGIETGYRVQNIFRAYTTSQFTSMRIWLMGLGFVLMALWLFLNLLFNRHQGETIEHELCLSSFHVHRQDRLVLIAKKFLRWLQQLWRQQGVF